MQNQDTVTAVSYYSLVAVWNILTEYPSAYRLPPAWFTTSNQSYVPTQ